jgi:D-apionolactonase
MHNPADQAQIMTKSNLQGGANLQNHRAMLPKTVYHYGSREEIPEPLSLTAGPLTMQFEPLTGVLRYIRIGDHEIVRAIYAAVRDQNWGTVPPRLSNLKSRIDKDCFQLDFDVQCSQGGIDYFWQGSIKGTSDGTVQYRFDGAARSEFFRNRIGLCVLHPMQECAGQPCAVVHSNGSEEKGTFPKSIAPDQPFFDVRNLSYSVAGVIAKVQFEGDEFEMEDQRNWSDASFKTYCTPQSRPKPHLVRSGDEVHQSVTVAIEKPPRPVLPVLLGRPPQLSIATTPVVPVPPLGFALPQDLRSLTQRETERLRQLRPAHLRVDLQLSNAEYGRRLALAAEQSAALNTPLHAALILSDAAEQELTSLADQITKLRPRIGLWLLFHEKEEAIQERWVTLAREVLQPCAPGVLFAAGTLDFFTEVNRNRPPANASAFSCFSQNPQVHAFDNATMVENLAGMATSLESLRSFSAKPAVVSPVTLKIRSRNAVDRAGELPADVDPRQMSLLGAGWTLGSIAQLAATGNVQSLTYFETIGWRGLMEGKDGSLAPNLFPSIAESVFPVYHIFADIAQFPGRQVYPTHSSHPLSATGLTLADEKGRRRVLAANFTPHRQELKIKSGTCRATIRYLDETNVERAMKDPESFQREQGAPAESVGGKLSLNLMPFGLARIDIQA